MNEAQTQLSAACGALGRRPGAEQGMELRLSWSAAHGPRVTVKRPVLWLYHGHADGLQVASDKLKRKHSNLAWMGDQERTDWSPISLTLCGALLGIPH